MSTTVGIVGFAPVIVTTTTPPLPVRSLPNASRACTVIVVSDPAMPDGTVAVVCVGEAAPGLTELVYGLPPIGDVFSVIARLSVPVVVGV